MIGTYNINMYQETLDRLNSTTIPVIQGWADESGQNCEAYNRASDLNEKLKICGRHV